MKPKEQVATKVRSQAQIESIRKYYGTKRGHIAKFKSHAQQRAKKANLPFDLTLEYLESIAGDACPVFKKEFRWGRHKGKADDFTPSLDRVIPELGYVQGNVVFISNLANRIKSNATEKELYAVADWLHDERKRVLNATKNRPTPVPVEHTEQSQTDATHWSVHGAGVGEDCDGAHHHRGEPEGEDPCDSTQASCRICMGSGSKQLEALELYEGRADYGLTDAETESLAKLFGCVCYQR